MFELISFTRNAIVFHSEAPIGGKVLDVKAIMNCVVLVVDFVEAFFVDRHAIDDDFHIEVKQKIVKELMQELECSNLLR